MVSVTHNPKNRGAIVSLSFGEIFDTLSGSTPLDERYTSVSGKYRFVSSRPVVRTLDFTSFPGFRKRVQTARPFRHAPSTFCPARHGWSWLVGCSSRQRANTHFVGLTLTNTIHPIL